MDCKRVWMPEFECWQIVSKDYLDKHREVLTTGLCDTCYAAWKVKLAEKRERRNELAASP